MRTINSEIRRMMPGAARVAPVGEVPLLGNEAPMPPHERIGRNDAVEFEQGLASYRLGFARQKSTLSICEPDSLSSQPVFEQTVLSLEKLDDEQLMPMDPARHN